MRATTLFLCELVRWQSDQKGSPETLVKEKLLEYCEKMLEGELTGRVRTMLAAIACLLRKGSSQKDLIQVPKLFWRICCGVLASLMFVTCVPAIVICCSLASCL